MGLGGIGIFVAHALMCLPNRPPISLIMHKQNLYEAFQHANRYLRVISEQSQSNDEQSGYDIDLAEQGRGVIRWRHISDQSSFRATTPPVPEELMPSGEVRIDHLILSTKAHATVAALHSIKHRLTPESTICFMQNGLGQVEEVNEKVFPDPLARPTYMLGILDHGVYKNNAMSVVHAGVGSVVVGVTRDLDKYPLPPKSSQPPSDEEKKRIYPTQEQLYASISSRYLLRTLTRSPILVCAAFPYLDLHQRQLEKLAVNCIINPLTALLDIPNGQLFKQGSWGRVVRLLIAEIATVIQNLPELQGIPNVKTRFSAARLEKLCVNIAYKTAMNYSSMREDIRNLRLTEINYTNGYIVQRGEELGLKCVLNFMMIHLIKGKRELTRELNKDVDPESYAQRDLYADTRRDPPA